MQEREIEAENWTPVLTLAGSLCYERNANWFIAGNSLLQPALVNLKLRIVTNMYLVCPSALNSIHTLFYLNTHAKEIDLLFLSKTVPTATFNLRLPCPPAQNLYNPLAQSRQFPHGQPPPTPQPNLCYWARLDCHLPFLHVQMLTVLKAQLKTHFQDTLLFPNSHWTMLLTCWQYSHPPPRLLFLEQ